MGTTRKGRLKETIARRKDGTSFATDLSVSAMFSSIICITRDITARKMMESDLQKARESEENFLASMSHEVMITSTSLLVLISLKDENTTQRNYRQLPFFVGFSKIDSKG